MANLVSQQFNAAERGKLAAEGCVCRIRSFREEQLDSIVARRFDVVTQHEHEKIAYVDREP